MIDEPTKNKNIFYALICIAGVIIVGAALFLALFLVLEPASRRDVEQGDVLRSMIKEYPKERQMMKSVTAEMNRVQLLVENMYMRCVRGVEWLSQNLTWWNQTYTKMS